jgi:phenylpyruvate tautomerase PptA (4-oxalocrotonate tautomerase family)
MPVCFIEGPSNVSLEKRRTLVATATRAIHAAYPIPDTRVVVRANPPDTVGQDGTLGEPLRPMCFLEVPPGLPAEPKRQLARDLTAAVDLAFDSGETLVFFREYPLQHVAAGGRLQSENPELLDLARGMVTTP